MRGSYGRPMPIGGYAFCLICILVGVIAGAPANDEAIRQHEQECAPVVWRAGEDAGAWQLLTDQGYRPVDIANGTALVPPGCEGVTP